MSREGKVQCYLSIQQSNTFRPRKHRVYKVKKIFHPSQTDNTPSQQCMETDAWNSLSRLKFYSLTARQHRTVVANHGGVVANKFF